ncbi:11650_t:CDS:2, partial [Dentiscutata erythropus]
MNILQHHTKILPVDTSAKIQNSFNNICRANDSVLNRLIDKENDSVETIPVSSSLVLNNLEIIRLFLLQQEDS